MNLFIKVLVMLMCFTNAFAAGTYTATIDNTPISIEFIPGPYGPYEAGTATVSVNNVVYCMYSYQAKIIEDITVYYVPGFYTFIETAGVLNTYQDMNVTLYK